MSEIDDHIARLKVEKAREVSDLFAIRTAQLPDLLKPYHCAYPDDDRRTTRVIIPGKAYKIVVTWTGNGNDVVYGYYVRGEPMDNWNAALLRIDELSNEPAEDQVSETIWRRLKRIQSDLYFSFAAGIFMTLGWVVFFQEQPGHMSLSFPFFILSVALLIAVAKIQAESAK